MNTPDVQDVLNQYNEILEDLLGNNKKISKKTKKFINGLLPNKFKNIKKWNKKVYKDGTRVHYIAMVVQEFRNSELTRILNSLYMDLSISDKRRMQKITKSIFSTELSYGMLFEIGMKPHVFSPYDNPELKGKISTPDWVKIDGKKVKYYKLSNDQLKFEGVQETGNNVSIEGNFTTYRDLESKKEILVNYFGNRQPNFRIYNLDSSNKRIRDNPFFKNYLGVKGGYLWLRDNSGVKQVNFTEVETEALLKFWKWERDPTIKCEIP